MVSLQRGRFIYDIIILAIFSFFLFSWMVSANFGGFDNDKIRLRVAKANRMRKELAQFQKYRDEFRKEGWRLYKRNGF